MKIFLDANILVSVLNKEYPLFTHTSRIVSLATDPHLQFSLLQFVSLLLFISLKKNTTVHLQNKELEFYAST